VHRDRLCEQLHVEFPHYGFASHKGYSTPEHLEALLRHGACVHHRRSFSPVAAALARAAGEPLPAILVSDAVAIAVADDDEVSLEAVQVELRPAP
jgi:ribonuclease HII